MFGRILMLFLVLCLLLPSAAFADVEGGVRFDADRKMMTVSVSGLIPDNDYFLLVSGTDADGPGALAQRVYMNVVKATAEGTIHHAAIHAGLQEGQSVLMGGVFTDGVSPRTLGVLRHLDNALPLRLNVIEAEAFMGAAFTSLYIGDSVTSIGDRAFKDCTSLRTLIIEGDSVAFGKDVFDGCISLVIVCSAGSTAAEYAAACENVTCLFD